MDFRYSDALQGYLRPSEEEQLHYYAGLSGSPRLIAKTSTVPWNGYSDTARWTKRMWTVGNHDIVRKWCPELRTAIVRTLTHSLDWDCFYPIRIGHNDPPKSSPVVLLVCLPEPALGPQPWGPAMLAALQCRTLLQDYNIHNVEVEIKQSEFLPMASPASTALAASIDWKFSQNLPVAGSRDHDLAEINGTLMALLPYPGHRIEQEEGRDDEAQAMAGTMGLYLRLLPTDKSSSSASPAAVYGLTSRHVAVGKRVAADQDLRLPSSPISHDSAKDDLPSLRILTGGPSCIYNASTGLNSAGRVMKAILRRSQLLYFKNPDDPQKSELYDLHTASINHVEQLKNALKQMEEADNTHRTLGTVAYSPGHKMGSNGNFKDWALVQLAGADRGELSNKVYMAEHVTETMFRAEAAADVEPSQQGSFALNLDTDGFLQLHDREMPPQPPFAQDQRPSYLVAKRGQTTGLRFGITNEIEAVRRIPFSRDEPFVSYHMLVVDFVGGHFSQPGDSGSSVFDCTGRVMGIVDGGERATNVVPYMKKSQGVNQDRAGLPDICDMPSQETLPERFARLATSVDLGSQMPGETVGDAKPGEDPSPDVAFVTPIQWILDDMRELTGCEPEIL